MFWLIGKIFKLTLLLIIAGALVVVAALMFVDANDFKDEISNYLHQYTGQKFVINGNLEWSFRPEVALFLENVELNGTSNIKKVSIYLDPYSIISGPLTVESLQMSYVNLNIDWETAKENMPSGGSKKVVIKEADVNDATISFVDSTNNLHWELRNAEINTKNLMLNGVYSSSPVIVKGDLVDLNNNISFNVNTTFTADADKQTLSFNPFDITWHETTFDGSATISQYKKSPIVSAKLSVKDSEISELLQHLDPYFDNAKSKEAHTMSIDLEFSYYTEGKILDLTNINLSLNSGTLTGMFKIGMQSPYQANFELAANGLDFNPLIALAKATFPAMPSETLIPIDLIKDITMSGKFAGKKLTFGNDFVIDQLTVETVVQKGAVQLSPMMLNAYGSIHSISLYIDTGKDVPFFQISEQADNVDLEPWFTLFGIERNITGKAKVKLQLEAIGNTKQELLQSLTGAINLYVADGTYSGLNLNKLMEFEINLINDTYSKLVSGEVSDLQTTLSSLSSGWITAQSGKPVTEFKLADLKAQFKTGVSTESSFSLVNEDYSVSGNGTIDFVNDSVSLVSKVTSNKTLENKMPDLAKYIKETPFTIDITGTPEKLTYGPDVRGYALTGIEQLLEKSLSTATNKMVGATLPNQTTDKTANQLFVDSLMGLTK